MSPGVSSRWVSARYALAALRSPAEVSVQAEPLLSAGCSLASAALFLLAGCLSGAGSVALPGSEQALLVGLLPSVAADAANLLVSRASSIALSSTTSKLQSSHLVLLVTSATSHVSSPAWLLQHRSSNDRAVQGQAESQTMSHDCISACCRFEAALHCRGEQAVLEGWCSPIELVHVVNDAGHIVDAGDMSETCGNHLRTELAVAAAWQEHPAGRRALRGWWHVLPEQWLQLAQVAVPLVRLLQSEAVVPANGTEPVQCCCDAPRCRVQAVRLWPCCSWS